MSAQRPSQALPVSLVAIAALAIAVVAVIAIACGGGDRDGVDATPTIVEDDLFMVEITDFEFEPVNLSMPYNTSVIWSNSDTARHNAKARDGSWGTEDLDEGEEDAVIFDEAGTWEYYCTIHPYMEGILTVRED